MLLCLAKLGQHVCASDGTEHEEQTEKDHEEVAMYVTVRGVGSGYELDVTLEPNDLRLLVHPGNVLHPRMVGEGWATNMMQVSARYNSTRDEAVLALRRCGVFETTETESDIVMKLAAQILPGLVDRDTGYSPKMSKLSAEHALALAQELYNATHPKPA